MASATFELIIKAKSAVSAGIKKASASMKRFAKSNAKSVAALGRAFRKVGKVAVGAFTAMVAGMAAAGKRAEEFNKQIGQISTLADVNFRAVKREVRSLSSEFGLAKDELTKGLYDALSAGVPKDNAFEFLRVSAKAAIAGAASTAEAVDLLTTVMNGYSIPAEKAAEVSDLLFTTVKEGKTTISEMAASMGQVASIASSSGVEIEQLMAALATLTKQNGSTSISVTQIRGAIIAMNRELGDGWSKTMTLQEGMQAMADMAGGSQNELKKLTGRVEGMNAILGITGEKAEGAALDLEKMGGAAGSADEAFGKMENLNAFQKMIQTIDNAILILGDIVLVAFGKQLDSSREDLQEWLDAFDSEKIDRVAMQLSIFAVTAKATAANIADTFTRIFGGLPETIAAPFNFVAEVIGSLINGVVEQLKFLGAVSVEIAKKIRSPFEHKFQLPDSGGVTAATNEFAESIGGRAFRNEGDADLLRRIEERQQKEMDSVQAITDMYNKRQAANQAERAKAEREAVGTISDAKAKAGTATTKDIATQERSLTDENLGTKLETERSNKVIIADEEHDLDMANIGAKKDAEIEAVKEVAKERASIEAAMSSGGATGPGGSSDRNFNLTAIIQAREMAKVQAKAFSDAFGGVLREVLTESNAPIIEGIERIATATESTAASITDAITMGE